MNRHSVWVRLPEEHEGPLQWLGPEGSLHRGAWPELGQVLNGRNCRLLAPATLVTLHQVDVPMAARDKRLRAIPFALEDHLIDPVDSLHFTIGPVRKHSPVDVAVVRREVLARWLDSAADAGVEVEGIWPEVLALPLAPGRWTVALEDTRSLFRLDRHAGLSVDAPLSETVWRQLTETHEQAPPLLLLDCRSHAGALTPPWLGTAAEVQHQACENLLQAMDARQLPPALDLRQGAYAAKNRHAAGWRAWRWSAALLLLLLALAQVDLWQDYEQARAESQRLNQAMGRLLQTTFPDIRRVVNPKLQMQQRLRAQDNNAASVRGGPLAMLHAVSEAVRREDKARMESFDFRDGRMNIQWRLTDLQSVDRLRTALAAQGLDATVDSASSTGGTVTARTAVQWAEAQ